MTDLISTDVISWRRALHAMPELRMDTPNTEACIAGALKKLGAEDIRTGVGGHGVTAYIRGYNKLVSPERKNTLWQSSYYDEIIRSEAMLLEKRSYIFGNPSKWMEDPLHIH